MLLPAGYSTWVKDIDRHRGGAEHCSSDAILPGHRASVVDQSEWNAPTRSTNQIHRTLPRRAAIHQARSQRKKICTGTAVQSGWTNENWIYSNERRKIKWMGRSSSIDINYVKATSATHSLWPNACWKTLKKINNKCMKILHFNMEIN